MRTIEKFHKILIKTWKSKAYVLRISMQIIVSETFISCFIFYFERNKGRVLITSPQIAARG